MHVTCNYAFLNYHALLVICFYDILAQTTQDKQSMTPTAVFFFFFVLYFRWIMGLIEPYFGCQTYKFEIREIGLYVGQPSMRKYTQNIVTNNFIWFKFNTS